MLMLADFRKKKMNNLNSQQILDPKLVNVVKFYRILKQPKNRNFVNKKL